MRFGKLARAQQARFRETLPLPARSPTDDKGRRLLADEVERSGLAPDLAVDQARVVVVCPSANVDYVRAVPTTPLAARFPDLSTVEAVMQATLREPWGISVVHPEAVSAGMLASAVVGDLTEWRDYHVLRYGWSAA
jgi:hypothetical protein